MHMAFHFEFQENASSDCPVDKIEDAIKECLHDLDEKLFLLGVNLELRATVGAKK
jgi:hypothetical protein